MVLIEVEDIEIDLVQKRVKNLRLTVSAPKGRVRISAPLRMQTEDIRRFVISKLNWIRKYKTKFEALSCYAEPGDGQFLYLGAVYPLKCEVKHSAPAISFIDNCLNINLRPEDKIVRREQLLDKWYRDQLKILIPPMIAKWEIRMGVEVQEYGIKKMKTRWGTCNPKEQRIWLNLELAKRPVEFLEYVVVHEMVHLLERGHGKRFIALMDKFLPDWRTIKARFSY